MGLDGKAIETVLSNIIATRSIAMVSQVARPGNGVNRNTAAGFQIHGKLFMMGGDWFSPTAVKVGIPWVIISCLSNVISTAYHPIGFPHHHNRKSKVFRGTTQSLVTLGGLVTIA